MTHIETLLEQIEGRLKRAIPGPIIYEMDQANNDCLKWTNIWTQEVEVFARFFWPGGHPYDSETDELIGEWWENFGRLAAHAPEDLKTLIALVRNLEAQNAMLVNALQKIETHVAYCEFDSNGGPDKAGISHSRNEMKHLARSALVECERIAKEKA